VLTPVLVCEAMHWSWQELMDTPAEVVDDVVTLLQLRGRVARQRRAVEDSKGRR